MPQQQKKYRVAVIGRTGKGDYGPTGAGDDWVRMGPLKVFLDGGMLIGTAYMREPYGASAAPLREQVADQPPRS